ncbi:hypothetical protein ACT80S_05375 [Ramlibacter sp. MAHUQ-53]|uniref:hypothetical protein n=1 Tax=unclassified Ramlibacter TaxID=2617605 RepID=UPI00363ED10C
MRLPAARTARPAQRAQPAPARRPGGARAWAAGLLLACLLLAQALALVHRVVHVAPGAAAHSAAPVAAAHADPAAASSLARLFAGHADDAGCRLYDALAHDGLPWAAPVAPALAVALALPPAAPAGCVPALATAFDARGPPALN